MTHKVWIRDQLVYWHRDYTAFHIYWTCTDGLRVSFGAGPASQACEAQMNRALKLAGEYKHEEPAEYDYHASSRAGCRVRGGDGVA